MWTWKEKVCGVNSKFIVVTRGSVLEVALLVFISTLRPFFNVCLELYC